MGCGARASSYAFHSTNLTYLAQIDRTYYISTKWRYGSTCLDPSSTCNDQMASFVLFGRPLSPLIIGLLLNNNWPGAKQSLAGPIIFIWVRLASSFIFIGWLNSLITAHIWVAFSSPLAPLPGTLTMVGWLHSRDWFAQ